MRPRPKQPKPDPKNRVRKFLLQAIAKGITKNFRESSEEERYLYFNCHCRIIKVRRITK